MNVLIKIYGHKHKYEISYFPSLEQRGTNNLLFSMHRRRYLGIEEFRSYKIFTDIIF